MRGVPVLDAVAWEWRGSSPGLTPENYAALFREDFRRRDQARWVAVYLRGLLGEGRKNVEGVVREAVRRGELAGPGATQALQNFLHSSPWDEGRLLRRYRGLVGAVTDGEAPAVVVRDLTLPKRGSRSVGVQRQYSREHGRKISCQAVVTLSLVRGTQAHPAAGRLYLPQEWARNPGRLEAAGVPPEHRAARTRAAIALELLDEVLREKPDVRGVVAGPGYGGSEELAAGVGERGLGLVEGPGELVAVEWTCRRLHTELGLDHFEGRSWRGFHHHLALVFLAHGYLVLRDRAERSGR